MSDKETISDDSEDTSEDRTEAQIWEEVQSARSSTSTSQDSEPEDASVDEEEIAAEPESEGEEPEPKAKAISEDPQDADDEPDEQRQEDDKAKRLAGIVSARDRQINSQTKRIRELEEKIAGFAAKAKPQEDDSISSLDELKETYPDIVGPLAEKIRKQDEQLRALTEQFGSVAELTAERSRETYDRETQILAEKMPDWKDTVEKNRSTFWAWVEDQPRADRDLAYSSQEHVVDGEGLHNLLSRFKTHLKGEVHPELGSSEPESKRTQNRRLDGARTVPSRGSQAATTRPRADESDPVALWNKVTAEKERARQRR